MSAPYGDPARQPAQDGDPAECGRLPRQLSGYPLIETVDRAIQPLVLMGKMVDFREGQGYDEPLQC